MSIFVESEIKKRAKSGDRMILAAFGGGFTWGAAYLTWAYDGAKRLNGTGAVAS